MMADTEKDDWLRRKKVGRCTAVIGIIDISEPTIP